MQEPTQESASDVKAKQLLWQHNHDSASIVLCTATTPFGKYTINDMGLSWTFDRFFLYFNSVKLLSGSHSNSLMLHAQKDFQEKLSKSLAHPEPIPNFPLPSLPLPLPYTPIPYSFPSHTRYLVGDHISHLPIPGIVRSLFTTHAGEQCYVIELIQDSAPCGLLYILTQAQIKQA